MSRFAEAIQVARVDVVQRMVVNGGGDQKDMASSNLMEGLLTLLLSDKLGVQVTGDQKSEPNPEADRLRDEIRKGLSEKREDAMPAAPSGTGAMPPATPPTTPAPGTSLPPAAPTGPAAPPSAQALQKELGGPAYHPGRCAPVRRSRL